MNNLGTLAFVVSIVFLPYSMAQTNVPPYSPPPPPLEEGQTWEDWTNSIEYKVITERSTGTNIVIKNTGDATNTPADPDITYVQPVESGNLRQKEYPPVEFVVTFQEKLTGDTNLVVSIRSNTRTGFVKTKVVK